MQNNTEANIDDAKITQKIEASFFESNQKAELIRRLPQMNEDEKLQLLAIIEKAEKKIVADETYQKNLAVLNKETENTMHKAVREETSNARKEFEAYDAEVTAVKLKEVEKEFESLPDTPKNKQK